MKEFYSVVIVGAGPAGSNLARLIDSKKYDVLLLDGMEQRGDKVCAGLLSPDAQDLLAEYDISLPKEIMASPQLFSVKTMDLGSDNVQYYRRSYMNVDRAKFDRFLFDMVPGTVDKVSGVCRHIAETNGGYELTINVNDEEKKIRCEYLVGADGANSIVRRTIFSQNKIKRYTAIQQWFSAEDVNPYYSCIFDNATSPSCSWIFFKDGRMIFGGAFAMENPRAAFEMQKKKLVEKGIVPKRIFENPMKTEACLVARPYFLHGVCRGNEKAFLIGEAAGFISPSSLEGISFALKSGEALANAFGKGVRGKQILREYKNRTAKLCLKVKAKCMKRPFMYHKILRTMVMKSGIGALKIRLQEVRYESEKFV